MQGGVELGELQFGDGAGRPRTNDGRSTEWNKRRTRLPPYRRDGRWRPKKPFGSRPIPSQAKERKANIVRGALLEWGKPESKKRTTGHTPYAQLVLNSFRFYNPPPLCRVKDGSFFGGPIVRQSRFRRLLGAIVAAAVAAYSGLTAVILRSGPSRPSAHARSSRRDRAVDTECSR